ncbi:MAG TPA: tetraacyldisaccharide 4'-kinase [Bacteroidales bacterium]|nr:tetraacyldisaccharide 4'-kinase [Bacteroidales bacterium]
MAKPNKNIVFYLLSWLYGGITQFRNFLFDAKILSSTSFQLPIISIGNLAVGGTGKTPHTEFLLNILGKDWKTAVLSRGYKRQTKGYRLANKNDTAKTIGDEPFQIYSKFPNTAVAVAEKRVIGIENLLKEKPEIEVILLDDAYQHRHVKPGLSILLTEFNKLYSDDYMLPYGSLREWKSNNKRADIIIVTKCDEEINTTKRQEIEKKLNIKPHQQLFFSTFRYGKLYAGFENDNKQKTAELDAESHILLWTGIENPQPMWNFFQEYTSKITPMFFPDHHDFTEKEIEKIDEIFLNLPEKKLIITTEKDLSRLKSNEFLTENIRKNLFVLPLEVKILNNEHKVFTETIKDYVTKNSRNS